jgi:F-type H+-transporting ATPase subunit delta
MKLARNYAEALFTLVDIQRVEAFIPALEGLAEIVKESSEVRSVVSSPSVSLDNLVNAFMALLASEVRRMGIVITSEEAIYLERFLSTILSNRRGLLLPEICHELSRLCAEQRNIKHLLISSSFVLAPNDKLAIEEQIRKALQKDAVFDWRHDKDLLGGIVIQLDNQVLDLSIRENLRQLQQAMA